MNLDELDIKILKENFDDEIIGKIDVSNVAKINRYLISNGVYYVNDLFALSLDLFLMPEKEFIKRFEKLKQRLGDNFIDILGEDFSLIELCMRIKNE